MSKTWTLKPVRESLLLALIYLIPSMIYILVSSQITADIATTREQAVFFEIAKGLIFVSCTAGILWLVSWKALAVIRRRQTAARELREALLHSERRATTGLLAASIAHDARNELAVLKSNNQYLQRQHDVDEVHREVLDDQAAALDRLIALTSRFTDVEHHQTSGPPRDVRMGAIAREVIRTLQGHVRLEGCEIRISGDENPRIRTHPVLIHQVLINLIFNAADAIDGGGTIELGIREASDAVVIEVHDSGPGIPESKREEVFDAFYTTKKEGTGLGLMSVRACAHAHRGHVEVTASPLGGACFRVLLRDRDSEDESVDDSRSGLMGEDALAG